MSAANRHTSITRHYVIGRHGELHLRSLDCHQFFGPTLMCLHPAPYSGLYFETVMPLFAGPASVIAPDYPGYGGSRSPEEEPDISAYAAAMLDVADAVGDGPLDLLGFHTGCLVAVEMALQRPERVGRLILIDIPYFTGASREARYASAAQSPALNANLDCLKQSFEFNVANRLDHLDYGRAFELFVEQLRPGNRANWALLAAFSYDAAAAFKALQAQGLIIATQSGLLEPTRQAAGVLRNMPVSERLDVTRSVFEEGAGIIASEVNALLNEG